jgi:hypothetical protein
MLISKIKTILQHKAKRVRKMLKKEGLNEKVATENADERKGLAPHLKTTLMRPIRFLFTEPIVMLSAIYNGYLFGIVCMLTSTFLNSWKLPRITIDAVSTVIFQGSFTLIFGKPNGHEWNTGEEGLSFLGLLIGTLVGAAMNPIQDNYYRRRIKEEGKGVPEARMWMARWGSFLFPISLFWFAWTSYHSGMFT